MKFSAKRPVAAVLLLLYALFGAGGESLHYVLNTGPEAPPLTRILGSLKGYFHIHGPDFQVHFHLHRDPFQIAADEKAQAVEDARRTAEQSGRPALKHRVTTHTDHPCPLLSVVSLLKLGAGGLYCSVASESPWRGRLLAFDTLFSSHKRVSQLARGPPALALA